MVKLNKLQKQSFITFVKAYFIEGRRAIVNTVSTTRVWLHLFKIQGKLKEGQWIIRCFNIIKQCN